MKKNYIISTFAVLAIGISLISSSGGRDDDRTGAPGSAGNCGNCHMGGTFPQPQVLVAVVEKGKTDPVSSYKPGVTYTIGVSVLQLTSTAKGMQSTVLDASNKKIGTTSNASSGSSVKDINNRDIVTQTSSSTTGVWTYEWTAPANPTGSVTIYTYGVIGSGSNGSDGDNTAGVTKVLTLDNSAKNPNAPKMVTVSISPVPANNVVKFSQMIHDAEVFTTDGKKVATISKVTSLNISQFSTGIYIVKGATAEGAFSAKFIKQ